jgi:diguanylate cyclase (GGDEF)-like protein/PAS domain S-box-containing protein
MKYWLGMILLVVLGVGILGYSLWRLPPLLQETSAVVAREQKQIEGWLRSRALPLVQSKNIAGMQAFLEEIVALPGVQDAYFVDKTYYIQVASQSDWRGEFNQTPCVFPDEGRDKVTPNVLRVDFVKDAPQSAGFACVRYEPTAAVSASSRLQEFLLLFLPTTVLLLIVVGFTFYQQALRNVAALSAQIKKITEGHWQTRLYLPGNNIIAEFARSLDNMVQKLSTETAGMQENEERFMLAARGSNDIIWDWNIETNGLYLSPRFGEVLGYTTKDIPGIFVAWLKIFHPDDLESFQKEIDICFRSNQPLALEVRLRARDGVWRWMLVRGTVIRNDNGASKRMVGSLSDIHSRKKAEAMLRQEKERLETTLASIVDAVITTDRTGRIEVVNLEAEEMIGLTRKDLIGLELAEVLKLYYPDSRQPMDLHQMLENVAIQEHPISVEEPVVCRTDQDRQYLVLYQISPLRDYSGMVIGTITTLHDVTEKAKLTKDLSREKEKAQVTLDSIANGVITTDTKGRVENMNPKAESLSGWTTIEARGKDIWEVLNMREETARRSLLSEAVMQRVLEQGEILEYKEAILAHQLERDKRYFVSVNVSPIIDSTDTILGSVLIIENNTEQRKLNMRIQYEATHDSLTGLLNRVEIEKRIAKVLDSLSGDAARNFLMALDLDQFKLVNDTSGHKAGDELLKMITKILQASLPSKGVHLARLGGDDFVVLLESLDLENVMRIARVLRQEISNFVFEYGGYSFTVGVSIGVVPIKTHFEAEQDVMKAAEQAVYLAKSKGRNTIQIYEGDETRNWGGEMQWVHRLTSAMRQDKGLVLFAQPIVPIGKDMDTSYRHYELLIRMQDENGKIVSPGFFLPGAERYGLISELDQWVLRSALRQIRMGLNFNKTLQGAVFAINLSGDSLASEEFLDFAMQQVKDSGIPTNMLCFEVTESVAVRNMKQAVFFVESLKKLGCKFSLDDFGSGYASFNYLKSFPVNYLKIDGGFIKNILTDPYDGAMVQAIHYVSKHIGLQTIAEFVENEEIVERLKRIGINYAQGYHFGKPELLSDVLQRKQQTGQPAE